MIHNFILNFTHILRLIQVTFEFFLLFIRKLKETTNISQFQNILPLNLKIIYLLNFNKSFFFFESFKNNKTRFIVST